MRFEAPASRYGDLVDAARATALELDDYAIDRTGAYGWPMFGNGCAVVIAVVDDDQWNPEEVVGTSSRTGRRCRSVQYPTSSTPVKGRESRRLA